MIVRFDDIGGIVDHHCLNFLVITNVIRAYSIEDYELDFHPTPLRITS